MSNEQLLKSRAIIRKEVNCIAWHFSAENAPYKTEKADVKHISIDKAKHPLTMQYNGVHVLLMTR